MIEFLTHLIPVPVIAVLIAFTLLLVAMTFMIGALVESRRLTRELYMTQLNEERLLAQLRVARNTIAEKAAHAAAVKAGRTKLTCALATDEHGRRYNAVPGEDAHE